MNTDHFCTLASLFGGYSQMIAMTFVTASMLYLIIWRMAIVSTSAEGVTARVKMITASITLIDIALLPAMVGPNVSGCFS